MNIAKNYIQLPQEIKEHIKDANVFFTDNYAKYLNAAGNQVWYIFDEACIIPVNIYKKAGILYAAYPSEPFALRLNTEDADIKLFLNNVQNVLRKNGIASVNSMASALFSVYPDKSKRIPFGSHIVDLSLTEEELWANVHSKHRNSIRRAEKSGVVIKYGGLELIKDYVKLDEETWARSNRASYGEAFFKNIIQNMSDNALILIAYKDGIPQAGALYYLNKSMCYYMFGASIDRPEPGATNFLHWEAFKYLKNIGVKQYSFVGCRIGEDENSKYHTIQRFKERFGGPLRQGYMFKTDLIPWKCALFKIMYYLKHRKALTGAVEQEIDKWSELNK